MEVRPYQEKAVEIGVNNLKSGKDPSILVAATGAGKSHIIANICKRLNAPTLILQPSKEILDQNYAKLLQTGIRDVSIYSASRNSKIIDNYTYATIGSIKNYSLFKHFKYILMDECHLLNPKSLDSMYMKFFKAVNPIGICGLTATPYRRVSKFYKEGEELYYTSGFEMLNRIHPFFFKNIAYKVELAELIDMKYLAPVKYFVSKEEPKTLRINSTGSDFTDKSLFITSDLRKTKVAKAITYANEMHKRFITFVPSVANAYNLTEALRKNGIYIPTISAETPAKERDNLLLRYRNGEFKGMLNCGVFLIGLDVPSIDAVIWDRNTVHPAILYQGIGRGLRIDPANPNKVLHVYDVSGSILKTGPVEAFRIIKEDGFKDMLVTTVDGQQKQLTGRPVFIQKVSNLKYYNRT